MSFFQRQGTMNCPCQTCGTAPSSSLRGWVSSLLSPGPALDFLHLHIFCWRPQNVNPPNLPGAQAALPPSLYFCSQARRIFGVGAAETLSCSWGRGHYKLTVWGFWGLSAQQVLGIDSGSPAEGDTAPAISKHNRLSTTEKKDPFQPCPVGLEASKIDIFHPLTLPLHREDTRALPR